MIIYEWFYREGEEDGEQVPPDLSPDPEASAGGEASGDGEDQQEAAPEYSENEKETEETEGEEEEVTETESDQYGALQLDYTQSLSDIHSDLEALQTIGYSLLFLLSASLLFSLIARLFRR